MFRIKTAVLSSVTAFAVVAAHASAAGGAGGMMGVPAPLAGAFGPVGIGVAICAYGGYRVVKHYRNR